MFTAIYLANPAMVDGIMRPGDERPLVTIHDLYAGIQKAAAHEGHVAITDDEGRTLFLDFLTHLQKVGTVPGMRPSAIGMPDAR